MKNWLTVKDPDAGKDWRQVETGTTEDEMVGCHQWLNGHEFEQALGVDDGQGSLECCSPWGHKESDTTEQLNWTELWPKQDITPWPEKAAHRGWLHWRAPACYLESTFPVPKLWLPPPPPRILRPMDKKLLEFLKSFKYKEQWLDSDQTPPTPPI